MTLIKRAIVATAVVAASFGVVTAGNAGSPLCGSSKACIYDQHGFNALLATKSGGIGASNVATSINDLTSSWENKTSSNGRWYPDANSGGVCRNMPHNTELNYVGDSANDKLTSWATSGGC